MYKLAIITGFLGAVKNRYMTYREERPLREKFEIASKVQNLSGLELCYPQDFDDMALLKSLLEEFGLGVSAINFRSRRTGRWLRGSFTSELAEERAEVVADMKRAVDCARELGCGKISTCPLNEGSDYIFEMDYDRAYEFLEESIRQVAEYAAPDVRLCIEYKLNDPRQRCLLGSAGETLLFCRRVGMPNVGLTLDIGHAIQAGERAGQSVVLAAREERLFYVHLNDNDRSWDWDMLPGAYNVWDFLEFFYYLRRAGYNGWIAYDVSAKETDTLETFNTVTMLTNKLDELSRRIDDAEIARILSERNPNKSIAYLYSLL